jgi:lipopolysaccharide heptosyltransferase II
VARRHTAAHGLHGRGALRDRERSPPARSRCHAAARRSLRGAGAAAHGRARGERTGSDPDSANRDAAVGSLGLSVDRGIAILCPGAEFGPAKRWPAEHFADLARRFLADGLDVWMLGSPNDKPAAAAVLDAVGDARDSIRDLSGRTDLGTAIDLLSLATVVVSNDSGLMHAAAAVRAPLVALFGSSSPGYTPPISGHGAHCAHRHRLQSLLQARMSARTLPLHARARAGLSV